MATTPYLVVSGTVFGLVAMLYLLRLFYEWSVRIGELTVPLWLSWLGLVFAGTLCIWAFRLAGKSQKGRTEPRG